MITNQLEQTLALINLHVELQEHLTMQLLKANALITVTLGEDFLKNSKSVIYSYLWTLSDVLEQAKISSEKILNDLMKSKLTETAAEATLKDIFQITENKLSNKF